MTFMREKFLLSKKSSFLLLNGYIFVHFIFNPLPCWLINANILHILQLWLIFPPFYIFRVGLYYVNIMAAMKIMATVSIEIVFEELSLKLSCYNFSLCSDTLFLSTGVEDNPTDLWVRLRTIWQGEGCSHQETGVRGWCGGHCQDLTHTLQLG